MSKIITLKDKDTIIYPRTIYKQVCGDKSDKFGNVQGFIDGLTPVPESPYKYYTVRIDLNNPDPETSCTYMDDAVGMTPGYDGWKDTNLISGIRPCALGDNGEFLGYYTNKEDMSQGYAQTYAPDEEPTYDTMIEFPLMGYKLWNDDNYQYVSVTDDPNAEDKGYCYYAHSLNTEKDCDKIYIGAFLGRVFNLQNLRSFANSSPTVGTSLTDFRTYAANRGTGYSLISFYPWTLLQCLYVIIYKNLNSSYSLGNGYSVLDSVDHTGTTIQKPFCFGSRNDDDNTHNKFLGIEDIWGNCGQIIDGIVLTPDEDDAYQIFKTDYRNSVFTTNNYQNFNFSTSTKYDTAILGLLTSVVGNNISGFLPKDLYSDTSIMSGSDTYFSDLVALDSPYVGTIVTYGSQNYYQYGTGQSSSNGIFNLSTTNNYYEDTPITYGTTRLMYKHLANAGGGQ